MAKVIGIIPARLESKRLPGKLLLNATGKPLIVHTIEQAKKCQVLDEVIVATDSDAIYAACIKHCPVFITPSFDNGTNRCAEVVKYYPYSFSKIVVNIQGDEPEIEPRHVSALVTNLLYYGSDVSTLASMASFGCGVNDRSKVKVVIDKYGYATHFTREMLPIQSHSDGSGDFYRHVGAYAYRIESLLEYPEMDHGPYSKIENLEQLRFLWNAKRFSVEPVTFAHPGIDTPEDYANFCERFRQQSGSKAKVNPPKETC